MKLPFDPVKRAEEVEKIVMREEMRKYYRFRYARYYGGIATADTVGCNLLCAYCWNYFRNLHPEKHGEFYSPEEVAEKLEKIAARKHAHLFRISGAEPILGKSSAKHVARVIELTGGEFILETNGVILGYYPEIAEMFRDLPLAVRVTIKGWDERSFERITGARKEFFEYQLRALEVLRENGIHTWPAVMYDVFGKNGVAEVRRKLRRIGFERVELEYLEKYPFVLKNMKKRGVVIRA
mgnify:CR=1 FL=1